MYINCYMFNLSLTWNNSFWKICRGLFFISGVIFSFKSYALGINGNFEIEVNEISPKPNYSLTVDKYDKEQLVDKQTNRFPIWTDRKSIGWVNITPIKISATISKNKNKNKNKNDIFQGTLRIHTAKGLYAGVKVFKRVDIYTGENNEKLVHSGEYKRFKNELADRENHWIDINVNGVGKYIQIIIHADGKFIFVDEIEWIPKKRGHAESPVSKIIKSQLIDDSINRLKSSYVKIVDKKFLKHNINIKDSYLWVGNAWGELPVYPNMNEIRKASKVAHIIGMNTEKESSVFGFLNSSVDNDFYLEIDGTDSVSKSIELGKVKSILSSTGKIVFDPILPLKEKEKFSVKSHEVAYIWLSIDLSKLSAGHYESNIKISSDNLNITYSLPLKIDVIEDKLYIKSPAAINWGYSNELPIWNSPEQVMEDLSIHGINVFVVRPQHIPQPNIEGKFDIAAVNRLKSDIYLYKGKGQVLLFLGWNTKSRLAWVFNQSNLDDQKKYEILQQWLSKISLYMKNQGLNYSDWAIYPVDEPHGEKLEFLMKIARWIKKADPKVRIYANPTAARKGYATYFQLKRLAPLISIWQPSYDFAIGKGKKFFTELTQPWWVFNNPKPPVKQASPLNDYRLLAWNAWRLGASGIGFWSYSDTRKSSAWDDFDGMGPDWAVVYEGLTKPIASRRWEAFREGNEDYKLLKAVNKINKKAIEECSLEPLVRDIKQSLADSSFDSDLLNIYRRRLLNCLRIN